MFPIESVARHSIVVVPTGKTPVELFEIAGDGSFLSVTVGVPRSVMLLNDVVVYDSIFWGGTTTGRSVGTVLCRTIVISASVKSSQVFVKKVRYEFVPSNEFTLSVIIDTKFELFPPVNLIPILSPDCT